jgi:hypothetical protein
LDGKSTGALSDMARNLNGYTIFCDDIRQEIAGKASYIGVYQDNLITNAPFPMALPKFGISITVFYSPLKSKKIDEIPFRVFLPGEEAPALEGTIPLPEINLAADAPTNAKPLIRMTAHLILAPLHLKGPGVIRVEASVDGGAVDLGRIRIEQTDPAATATASAQPSGA